MSASSAWGMITAGGPGDKPLNLRKDIGLVRRLLTRYGRTSRLSFGSFIALSALVPLFSLAYPIIAGRVVNELTGGQSYAVLARYAVLTIVVAFVQSALRVLVTWLNNRTSAQVCQSLTVDFYAYHLRQSVAFFNWIKAGVLTSRGSNDLRLVEFLMYNLSGEVVINLFTLLYSAVVVFVISPVVGVASLALIPIFIIPARLLGKKVRLQATEALELDQELNEEMSEKLSSDGASLVRLYGSAEREVKSFRVTAGSIRRLQSSISVKQQGFVQAMILVTTIATAIVYLLGGRLAINGDLSAGAIVAVTGVLAGLYPPVMSLATNTVELSRVAAGLQRIFNLLDTPIMVEEKPNAVPVPAGPLRLQFRDVSFSYPSAGEAGVAPSGKHGSSLPREVLREVEFEINAGETVAIVGASGAGKSTIAQLAVRLYEPTRGVVSINDVPLSGFRLQDLRSSIGYVLQDGYFFHASISDNLRVGNPVASDDELWRALSMANLLQFVSNLADGLDTVVGDRGHRLSGGERQRLAIARLLLKNPRLMILDEATASLDNNSEVAVQRALDAAMAGRTCLVIAHRLTTVKNADRILVLDGGRIVERGTHEQLREIGGVYERLYLAGQFRDRLMSDPADS